MSVQDVGYIILVVFALGLGFLFVHSMMNTTINTLILNPTVNSSNSSVQAFEGARTVTNRMDFFISGVFFALCVALLISGYVIGGYPILMFIYFIVVVILVVVSAIMSNVWDVMSNNALLITSLSKFPITDFLLQNLPYVTAVVGFMGLMAMFAKPLIGGNE